MASRIMLMFFIGIISNGLYAQIAVDGVILDAETHAPMPYTLVKNLGINRGAITNEDGYFNMICSPGDSLQISFVGYDKLIVPFTYFISNEIAYLKPSNNELATVNIFGDQEYLYALLDDARKKLKKAEPISSKTYFSLETTADAIPVELLECYYNATIGPAGINDLALKNGRVGTTKFDETYFTSLNTTDIISDYRLLSKQESRLPNNPLQLSKSRLKKEYELKLLAVEGGLYKIQCKPQKADRNFFNAIVWIDKQAVQLARIDLYQNDLKYYPFVAIEPSHHLDSLNFFISYTFSMEGNQSLDKIEFAYDMDYNSVKSIKKMESKSVFLFFEKEAEFDLPYYSVSASNMSDYDKIVSQPYNPQFWAYNEILSPSRKTRLYKEYFKKTGVLLNFDELSKHSEIFKNHVIAWSENRLTLDQLNQGFMVSVSRKNDVHRTRVVGDYYEFTAHLYLDRNVQNDTVYYLSSTLIDMDASFYYLESNKNTTCMINMYFDLVELERRLLEDILNAHQWSKAQVDSIYNESQHNLDVTLKTYLEKVDHGDNDGAIAKYAKAINSALGVDNSLLIWSDYMVTTSNVLLDQTEPWVTLYEEGTVLMKIGKFEEALPYLEQAYQLETENAWLVFNLGLTYLVLGNKEEGCRYLAISKTLGETIPAGLISECE